MPSIMKTLSAVVAGLAAVSALPAQHKWSTRQLHMFEIGKRQNAAAAAAGLTDIDILQFALTLELLEAAFYQQGFARIPAADFAALGLNERQIQDLIGVGKSESAHVALLQGAIAQAGTKPVQACQYNFEAAFASASAMVQTAGILESVGVSAYLGAGVLVSDPSILGTAASILTIEARHETFVRVASGLQASPAPFDTAISPRQVFSAAAPFIVSCPEGSNLAITPFAALSMAPGAQAATTAGQSLNIAAEGVNGATHCAFTNGNIIGGTTFAPFVAGTGCVIPQNIGGITYVSLTNSDNLTGKLTDDMILAGPMIVRIS